MINSTGRKPALLFYFTLCLAGIPQAMPVLAEQPGSPASALALDLDAARQRMFAHHPELAALEAERQARLGQKITAGRWRNPELEVSAVNLTRRQSEVLLPDQPYVFRNRASAGPGWEAGIRQEIETGGQRGIRVNIKDMDVREQERLLARRRIELGAELNRHFFGYHAEGEMQHHLEAIYRRVQNAMARLGPGYRDPRLGVYVQGAMRSNLLHMEAARERATLEKNTHLNWLRAACGGDVTFVDDPKTLTRLLDASRLPPLEDLVERARNDSPVLALGRIAVERSRAEAALAGREISPSLTLFAYVGEDRTGRFAAVDASGDSESNRYVRAGLSFPLPLWNRNQGERVAARAREGGALASLAARERSLERELRLEYEFFTREASLSLRLAQAVERAESAEGVLIDALLSGRLSFLEFWTEHDRHHELLLEYIATTKAALEARGRLESLTGVALDLGGNL